MPKQLIDYSDYVEDNYKFRRHGVIDNFTDVPYAEPRDRSRFFKKRGHCPFCRKDIGPKFSDYVGDPLGGLIGIGSTVWECPDCLWWEFARKFLDADSSTDQDINEWYDEKLYHGVAKRFAVSDRRLPVSLCLNELQNRKESLYDLDPYVMEELVQYVFSSMFDCEVQHVGRTGDGGIDLIVVNSDDPILVQVKRHSSPDAVESVSVVREFIGAMYLRGSFDGIVVSTARKFSNAAQAEIRTGLQNRKFRTFSLVDYPAFCSMLDLTHNPADRPWVPLVNTERYFDCGKALGKDPADPATWLTGLE